MFYSKKENKYSSTDMDLDYTSLYPNVMKNYNNSEFIALLKREERKRKLRQIDENRENY